MSAPLQPPQSISTKRWTERFRGRTPYYGVYPSQSSSQGSKQSILGKVMSKFKNYGQQSTLAKGALPPPYTYQTGQMQGTQDWSQRFPEWSDIGEQYQNDPPLGPFFGLLGEGDVLPPEEKEFCSQLGIQFLNQLGQGGFGAVWLVNRTLVSPEGEQVVQKLACKVSTIKSFGAPFKMWLFSAPADMPLKEAVGQLLQEAEIIQELDHRNVLKCEHIFNIHDQITGFPYIRLLLLLELCDGDLSSMIKKSPGDKLPNDQAKLMMRDAAAGLLYLHNHNIVHFDIKPQNIMFVKEGGGQLCFKLGDFGLSKRFRDSAQDEAGRRGTLFYMAPELSDTDRYLPKPTDVYSLGYVLAETVCGGRFRTNVCIDWLRTITAEKWISEKNGVAQYYGVQEECVDLIRKMTTLDPQQRLTMREVCPHPWLQLSNVQPQQVDVAQGAPIIDAEALDEN